MLEMRDNQENLFCFADDRVDDFSRRENFDWDEYARELVTSFFLRNGDYGRLVVSWVAPSQECPVTVLDAHGLRDFTKWDYVDGRKTRPVQEWIREKDGTSPVLIITACNPPNIEISADQSLVFHSNSIASLNDHREKPVTRVYVPKYGYLDGHPTLLQQAVTELRGNGFGRQRLLQARLPIPPNEPPIQP